MLESGTRYAAPMFHGEVAPFIDSFNLISFTKFKEYSYRNLLLHSHELLVLLL